LSQEQTQPQIILPRLATVLLAGYVVAVVLFYFLSGEQLHLRQSRDNFSLPGADSGTVELVFGSVVEQRFFTEIQRLERIDIQWGTYYRPNAGIVLAELVDLRSGTILLSQTFDAAGIPEGGLTTLAAETPIEGLYQTPLLLRITSDSQPGSAISPLMNTQGREEGWELSLNGVSTSGILCFALSGTDYIWTGLHYWQFAVAGLVLILLFIAVVWLRVRTGKRSYVVNAVIAVQKYRCPGDVLEFPESAAHHAGAVFRVFYYLQKRCAQFRSLSDYWHGDVQLFLRNLQHGVRLHRWKRQPDYQGLYA